MKRNGSDFEEVVLQIQRKLAPDCEVLHDVRLVDRLGHKRQFDIVLRGTVGSYPVLGVIECKDLKRRVGTPQIEAFITKVRDLRANIALVVSRSGFTAPAVETATDYGIGTLSLLPDDPKDYGFFIGVRSYADVYTWDAASVEILSDGSSLPFQSFKSEDIRWDSSPVLDWFLWQLSTKHRCERRIGKLTLEVLFDTPQEFSNGESRFMAKGLRYIGVRRRVRKTRLLRVSGEALFDWQNELARVPPGGMIHTEGFRKDLTDWDPYDGDVPPLKSPLQFHLHVFWDPITSEGVPFPSPQTTAVRWDS